MDEMREVLRMDPMEFRRLNAAREGTRRVVGTRYRDIGSLETLQAAWSMITTPLLLTDLTGAVGWLCLLDERRGRVQRYHQRKRRRNRRSGSRVRLI